MKVQTELECGARVAQYIQQFTEWLEQNSDGETIIRRMKRGIEDEKNKQCDLAADSRKTLCNTLSCERQKYEGLVSIRTNNSN